MHLWLGRADTLIHNTIHSHKKTTVMGHTPFICLCIYIHSYALLILTHHSFLHTIHSYTPFILTYHTLIHTIHSYTTYAHTHYSFLHTADDDTRFACLCIHIHSYAPIIFTHHSLDHTDADVMHPIHLFMHLHTLIHTIHSYTPYTHTHHSFLHTIHSYTPFILTHHTLIHTIHSYTPYTHTHHSFLHIDDDRIHTIQMMMYSSDNIFMWSCIHTLTPGCSRVHRAPCTTPIHTIRSYTPFIHTHHPFIHRRTWMLSSPSRAMYHSLSLSISPIHAIEVLKVPVIHFNVHLDMYTNTQISK